MSILLSTSAFLAGCVSAWVLLRLLKHTGHDPLLSLYDTRVQYWKQRVADWQQALNAEIAEGSRASQLEVENRLNQSIERLRHWERMVKVRRG